MKILASARIVVLDADAKRCTSLCSALSNLGLLHVIPASSAADVQRIAATSRIDLCVVHPRGLAANDPPAIVPNPLAASATPAILIAADAVPLTPHAAARAGYRVVIREPVVPRLLYRRIGSVLQKVRRPSRPARPPIAPALVGAGLATPANRDITASMLDRSED
jgi:hypothetical protein